MESRSRSRILIIGATGYIGRHIANASLALGHPTFLLVRESAASFNSEKDQILESFKALGANIVHGSLEDCESLVEAIKKVDVVISAIGGGSSQKPVLDGCMEPFLLQYNIIKAIEQVGTIKRFLPAEFGNDVDRVNAVEPAKSSYFAVKAEIRRAIEEQGIPYTYICCNSFAGLFVTNLGQRGLRFPPRDKVEIVGNGNAKAVFMSEEDVGIFTIKAVDDERTVNKVLHFRPPHNTLSFNELVALWEKKIGKTLQKVYIQKDQLLKLIAGAPFAAALLLSIRYSFFVEGDQTNFKIGAEGVEACELYPDVKYTTVEECLDNSVDEREFTNEEVEEDSIAHEYFSNSSIQEEDLKNNFEDRVYDNNIVDTFDIISDVSNSCCYNEIVVQVFLKIKLSTCNHSCKSIMK